MRRAQAIRIFSLGLFLAFWSSLSLILNDAQVLPAPWDVLAEMQKLWQQGRLQENLIGADYDDRLQVALSYSIMGAKIGYTYNGGDINQGLRTESAESHLVSAAYGSYGQGLYVAAVYGSNENMNFNGSQRLAESDAYEALLAYALPSSLNLSINYEMVEGKVRSGAKTETAREEMAVQAEYNFTSKFVGYAGYQFDLNDAEGRETDDKWALGARYYL